MYKQCKVVLLPTNEKAKNNELFINGMYRLVFFKSNKEHPENKFYNSQHLYILSDEEIKDGDWYIVSYSDDEGNIHTVPARYNVTSKMSNDSKKIIATTDKSLTIETLIYKSKEHTDRPHTSKFQFPQLSQSFIEKYVKEYNKGNIITKVMVEYRTNGNWEFKISSGYNGRRCVNCNTWNYQEKEYDCSCGWKLKINPDNTINIKLIKDSYSKCELKKN